MCVSMFLKYLLMVTKVLKSYLKVTTNSSEVFSWETISISRDSISAFIHWQTSSKPKPKPEPIFSIENWTGVWSFFSCRASAIGALGFNFNESWMNLKKILHSWRRLMWSFGQCHQIGPDWPKTKVPKTIKRDLQRKAFYVSSLGIRETDNINRMSTISLFTVYI